MERLIHAAAGLVRALRRVAARKWSFLGVAMLAFSVSFALLARLDLLPETPPARAAVSPLVAPGAPRAASARGVELPLSIEIPAVGLSAKTENPETTSIAALDSFLLHGAVRYPTSARLGEDGNLILFGHSSYLPVVNNPAYKTFNGIQKLKGGDRITLYSADAAYIYAVRDVQKEDAESAAIPLSVAGRVLTLSTCDSFGKKSDRFVITADFVESHPLAAS